MLANRILTRVRRVGDLWGSYTLELTLDALLEYHMATGHEGFHDYVFAVLYRRGGRREDVVRSEQRPFGHIGYTVCRCLADARLADAFVQESRKILSGVARSSDGLVQHRPGRRQPKVLVDFMQDYVARMARTGSLTGEVGFFAEAAEQVRLHRELLRDPKTGLWRQGRGWERSDRALISPGAWARGQGWVLRGLTDALAAIPPDRREHEALAETLRDLLASLLPLQDAAGFWRCLVDSPSGASAPETSGTALIAAALYRAMVSGWITGDEWRRAADRAFAAVADRVDHSGCVTGACAGPGPLNRRLRARCIGRCSAQDEGHGWFSVLYACTARAAASGSHSRASVTALRG